MTASTVLHATIFVAQVDEMLPLVRRRAARHAPTTPFLWGLTAALAVTWEGKVATVSLLIAYYLLFFFIPLIVYLFHSSNGMRKHNKRSKLLQTLSSGLLYP